MEENPYQAPQAPPPLQGAPMTQHPPTRSGKFLILDRQGPALPPDFCFKCNNPANKVKSKLATWSPPAYHVILLTVFLLGIFGLLIWGIVLLCVQKKARVSFGMCSSCLRKRLFLSIFSLLAAVASMAAGVYGLADERWTVFLGGVLGFFAFLIAAAVFGRLVYAKRIDHLWVWLAGGGKEYLERYPPTPQQYY